MSCIWCMVNNSKPLVQDHISLLLNFEFRQLGMEHLDNSKRSLILDHCLLVSSYTRQYYSTVGWKEWRGFSILNQYIKRIWRFELGRNSRNSLGFLKELVDRLHLGSMYHWHLPFQ